MYVLDAILNLLADSRSQAKVKFPPEMLSALKSNGPPSSQAIQTALAIRMEPAEEVTRIDAESASLSKKIRLLESQILDLKKRRQDLEKEAAPHRTKIRACDAITSPIRRLPFELLREIARHTMPTHPKPCKNQAPLSLCGVSSAWKSAVLSSTDLWSTLYMSVKEPCRLLYFTDTILEWCGRAKEKPLTLYMYFTFIEHDTAFLTLPSNLSSLAPVISRVRHLGLGAGMIDDFLPYLVDTHWDLDHLESLYLTSFSGEGYIDGELDEVIPGFELFNQAPNLQKVTIGNEFVTLPGALRLLPWSRITSLTLTEWILVDVWVEVLEFCPQMRTGDFVVRQFGNEDLDDFRYGQHVHEHLEDLTFETHGVDASVLDILSIFKFPMLHCLDLRNEDNSEACILPKSSNTFRNLANIRSLVVDEEWDSDTGWRVLTDFLRKCSNLENLTLTTVSQKFSSPKLSPLFTAMSLDLRSPKFLPNLAILNVRFSESYGESGDSLAFDTDAFSGMIESRLRSDIGSLGYQPLKKVFVYIPRCNRNAGVLERMKTLIPLDSVSRQFVTLTDLWGRWSLERPRELPYYHWYRNVHFE